MEERRGHFDAHAAAFAAVVGEAPRLELVARTDAHEGPFYVSYEDALYFTTVPRASTVARRGPQVAIKPLRLDGHRFLVSGDREAVVKADANVANGMALDRGGALVVCEQGTPSQHARLSRFDPTNGEVATVVDGWTGQCLNSPNDVAVNSDGTICLTDPSYGHLQGFRPPPIAGDHVYRTELVTVLPNDLQHLQAADLDGGVLHVPLPTATSRSRARSTSGSTPTPTTRRPCRTPSCWVPAWPSTGSTWATGSGAGPRSTNCRRTSPSCTGGSRWTSTRSCPRCGRRGTPATRGSWCVKRGRASGDGRVRRDRGRRRPRR